MEFIDVVFVIWSQKSGINEFFAVWEERKILKHEAFRELWVFDDHYHVLYSDPVLPVLVEAWLVRDAHALLQLCGVASADSAGPLVDAVEGTNAVACAVVVIHPCSPQVPSGESVKVLPGKVALGRPHDSFKI